MRRSVAKMPHNCCHALMMKQFLTCLALLFAVTQTCPAQDYHTITADVAQYAVQVYHAKVEPQDIRVIDFAEERHGDVIRTFAAVEFSEKHLNQRRTGHIAEVRITLVDVGRLRTIADLDYIDDSKVCYANIDHTAEIMAEYNIVLERGNHIAGLQYRAPLSSRNTFDILNLTGRTHRRSGKNVSTQSSIERFKSHVLEPFETKPTQYSPCLKQ